MDNIYLTLLGLNHNTAPVEIREKMFIPESDIPEFLNKIRKKRYRRIGHCLYLQQNRNIFPFSPSRSISFKNKKNTFRNISGTTGMAGQLYLYLPQ